MIRAILVDDKKKHLDLLRKYLQKYKDVIEVVDEFTDATEACAGIICKKPDVLFLDINMPGMTGLEMAQKVKKVCSNVVFLTDYAQQYATDAFSTEPVHFITKDKIAEYLPEAISKIQKQMEDRPDSISVWIKNDAVTPGSIKKDKNRYLVKWEDIICIEVIEGLNGNDLRIHTTKRLFEERNQINHYQKLLDAQINSVQALFLHINEHGLVNRLFVASLYPQVEKDKSDFHKSKRFYVLNPVDYVKQILEKNEYRRWDVTQNRLSLLQNNKLTYRFTPG